MTPRSLLPLFVLLAATAARATDYTSYLSGNADDVRPDRTTGSLLLSGGGGDVDEAFRWFVRQAGGGDIVVLRASGSDGYQDYLHRQIGGVDSVETIVFHARRAAHDPRVLDILTRAEGIFLAGGDQSRYVEFWAGTPVVALLDRHVRSGKPLGGTSAGLAVLGQFAFSARQPGDFDSAAALRDPFDQRVTLERDFLQLDLLRGIITDSHFTPRQRLGRLLTFLARLQEPTLARLAGLGIDERTALCLAPDGTGRVFTDAPHGAAWLVVPTQPAELSRGAPLTFRDVHVIAIGPRSTLHLPALTVDHPQAVTQVSVLAGQISPLP